MLTDFLSFERYLTPSIIRLFYVLQLVLIGLIALSGLLGGLALMANESLLLGVVYVAATLVGAVVGVIAARILTELVMVLFQNNEHLAVIRASAEGAPPQA